MEGEISVVNQSSHTTPFGDAITQNLLSSSTSNNIATTNLNHDIDTVGTFMGHRHLRIPVG